MLLHTFMKTEKREYIKPSVAIYTTEYENILAGSPPPDDPKFSVDTPDGSIDIGTGDPAGDGDIWNSKPHDGYSAWDTWE